MSWRDLPDASELIYRLLPPDAPLVAMAERCCELGLEPPSLETCRLLEILAGGTAVRRVLSIASDLGMGAVCLARGGAEAAVLFLGPDESQIGESERFAARAGVEGRVHGQSLDSSAAGDPVAALDAEMRFDLIHLAIGIGEVRKVTDRLLPALEVGGLVVVEGLASAAEEADAARSTAGYLVVHPQLDTLVLPIGGGVGVGRKKRPLVTEMGGPY